jgi:hypothetical protein
MYWHSEDHYPLIILKPESLWTTDYMTALRGLTVEISAAHRLHTVMLCTSLDELYKVGLDDSGEAKAASDGEIKIKNEPFDQNKGIGYTRDGDGKCDRKKGVGMCGRSHR